MADNHPKPIPQFSRAARGERNGSKLYPERLKRGQDNPMSKLTQHQADEIREKYKTGKTSSIKLSKEYGLSKFGVLKIIHNRSYITRSA